MRSLLSLALAVAVAASARADVKPHPLFADNMVLQQGPTINVWGQAEPGEQLTVLLQRVKESKGVGVSKTVFADGKGNWKAALATGDLKPGTGYSLSMTGKNEVTVKNVAVGEVWVCSGQSNMQWEFWRNNLGEQGKTVPASAKNPNLRLFTLQRKTATTPQYDFPVVTVNREGAKGDDGPKVTYGKWLECEPAVVQEFSAVAYYFGRELEKHLKVPVGLIVTSWGGMPAEAYTSLEALDADPSLKYLADKARAAAKQFEMDKKPVAPNSPTALYNSMTHPLLNFKVKGAIWYQGESNAGRAFEYRTLYPAMIKDWRTRWGGDFPFVGVQLAPFQGGKSGVDYAELRDAQLHATKVLPKVGIAVIVDAGHETDIHPPQKEPVGARLALNARALAYGEKIVYSGPVPKGSLIRDDRATIFFNHVGGGLEAKGSELVGFTVAGEDGVYHPAKAVIGEKKDTVVITSDKVEKIRSVRYGWVNFAKPTLNLFNAEGLPATPFRTDELPLTTMPKPKK